MQPTVLPPSPAATDAGLDIRPGLALPIPDEAAAVQARARLSTIDLGISAPALTALGALIDAVAFFAAVQGSAYPRPLLSTRVVLLTGVHSGGVVAGPAPDPRNALPLQHLAIAAGAGIVTLEWQPASAAIETEDAITPDQMDAALRAGWLEADRAADEGIELLVLGAGGAGAATAAAAVIAAVTGVEPPALLPRVVTPAGRYDDNAWMTRCVALRDALHRVRNRHGDPRTVLAALGGADIAAAVGVLLGAASRRTPIMIDGPVGAAAALLAHDFSAQARYWTLLPDHGRHPGVGLAAHTLGLRPWLDLCLDLGEGAAALAALPLLQTALTLAGVGEPAEDLPLTRYDSSGNQVFVGVARAVEPAADGPIETPETGKTAPAAVAAAAESAPVGSTRPATAGVTAKGEVTAHDEDLTKETDRSEDADTAKDTVTARDDDLAKETDRSKDGAKDTVTATDAAPPSAAAAGQTGGQPRPAKATATKAATKAAAGKAATAEPIKPTASKAMPRAERTGPPVSKATPGTEATKAGPGGADDELAGRRLTTKDAAGPDARQTGGHGPTAAGSTRSAPAGARVSPAKTTHTKTTDTKTTDTKSRAGSDSGASGPTGRPPGRTEPANSGAGSPAAGVTSARDTAVTAASPAAKEAIGPAAGGAPSAIPTPDKPAPVSPAPIEHKAAAKQGKGPVAGSATTAADTTAADTAAADSTTDIDSRGDGATAGATESAARAGGRVTKPDASPSPAGPASTPRPRKRS